MCVEKLFVRNDQSLVVKTLLGLFQQLDRAIFLLVSLTQIILVRTVLGSKHELLFLL